jgi:DedD protein
VDPTEPQFFSESQLTESQDATLLQRRARRRLVGAIALVVLIVIVLPIVLDKEPSPIGQDLVIQIPSQEAGKFNTRVLPPSSPPSAQAAAPTAAPGGAAASAPAQTEVKGTAPAPSPAPAPTESPTEGKAPSAPASGAGKTAAPPAKDRAAPEVSDAARAKAALEGKESWVVRLGAFSSEDNVKQLRAKLTAAGLKSYTESVKGPKGMQTRVRAGPFDSKPEAEKAQEQLVAIGLSAGSVAPR